MIFFAWRALFAVTVTSKLSRTATVEIFAWNCLLILSPDSGRQYAAVRVRRSIIPRKEMGPILDIWLEEESCCNSIATPVETDLRWSRADRSEGRRVGTEWVSTCRSR